MGTKKSSSASSWVDPDDAPELTEEWFAAGEIRRGEQLVRAAKPGGRPKLEHPKQAVNIRLDADLLAYFRATGPGWQSRMNEALRKAVGIG